MSARAFVRLPTGCARATTAHMPFPGHRTVATIWAQEEAAKKTPEQKEKQRQHQLLHRAKQYGFEAKA